MGKMQRSTKIIGLLILQRSFVSNAPSCGLDNFELDVRGNIRIWNSVSIFDLPIYCHEAIKLELQLLL